MLSRGYKQTFILLKIHAEMVENNIFQAKCPILAIFRKCFKWRNKMLCRLKLRVDILSRLRVIDPRTSFNLSLPLCVHLDAHVFTMEQKYPMQNH